MLGSSIYNCQHLLGMLQLIFFLYQVRVSIFFYSSSPIQSTYTGKNKSWTATAGRKTSLWPAVPWVSIVLAPWPIRLVPNCIWPCDFQLIRKSGWLLICSLDSRLVRKPISHFLWHCKWKGGFSNSPSVVELKKKSSSDQKFWYQKKYWNFWATIPDFWNFWAIMAPLQYQYQCNPNIYSINLPIRYTIWWSRPS